MEKEVDNNYIWSQESSQQNYFAQQLTEIVSRYLETQSFGKVYSITAGIPGQPLIMVVHGSGPKNSSGQYSYLLQEYLVRISYLEKFYIVAIDCPGYGKSIGSKEAIKTFPLKLFEELLVTLGYNRYFALFGHSQGGSAIFNAVHEKSSICDYLVMDRPVCGNIKRFQKFNMPTLLIYDIEDDGHPIWQGKQLYKQLNHSQLHTYRDSKDPYWVPDNIWDVMLEFFAKFNLNKRFKYSSDKTKPSIRSSSVKFQSKPDSRKTSRHSIKEKNKFIQKESQNVAKKLQYRSQSLDAKDKLSIQKKRLSKAITNQLDKVYEQDKQDLLSLMSHSLSDEENLQMKNIQQQLRQKQKQLGRNNEDLHRNISKHNACEIDQKVVIDSPLPHKVETPKKEAFPIQSENICAICYDTYFRPVQTNCSHIFCSKCILQSLLVDERCPLCRAKVLKKIEKAELHEEIQKSMAESQVKKRQKQYLRLKLMLDSIVYIQIGNKSVEIPTKQSSFTKTKKKYNWQLFAKEKQGFRFDEVCFDVNMGNQEAKPIRVRQSPFTFQSRGTFSFSCQIKIKPKNTEYATLSTIYRINVEPGLHTKKIAFKKKIFQKQ